MADSFPKSLRNEILNFLEIKKVESATAAIFKLLLVAEKNFRRLNAPELMREVYLGVRFKGGERATESSKAAAV